MKKAKKNPFSIYLLQEEKRPEDARMKNASRLEGHYKLPKKSVLYSCAPKKREQPWWIDYIGVSRTKFARPAVKSLLVFVPAGNRFFALTFGNARHYLDLNCCEADFGLLVALNSIDRDQVRSLDINALGSSLRLRIQANNYPDMDAFDLQQGRNLWRAVAGAVKEKYSDLFDWASGESLSLRCVSGTPADKMSGFLKELLMLYKSTDYKRLFPEVHKIQPVKKANLKQELDAKLEKEIQSRRPKGLDFSLPAVINVARHRMQFPGSKEKVAPFVDMSNFSGHVDRRAKTGKATSIKHLSDTKLRLIDEEEPENSKSFSLYSCVLYTAKVRNKTYYLNEGRWYSIERKFLKEVDAFIKSRFEEVARLKDCTLPDEDSYNRDPGHGKRGFICLHGWPWLPKRKTGLEPCDLYTEAGDMPTFIHVKKPASARDYSHLIQQALVSATLVRQDQKALDILNQRLRKDKKKGVAEANDKIRAVFAIISRDTSIEDLSSISPFSRISIYSTLKEFKNMAVQATFQYVKDVYEEPET